MKNEEILNHIISSSGKNNLSLSIYVIATGAGARLQKDIWDIPGASCIFSGAEFPYAQIATTTTLGYSPKKFVSEEVAIALAQNAYLKALLCHDNAIGLGMSCSVATNRQKRGGNSIYAAAMSNDRCIVAYVPLEQGIGKVLRLSHDGCASNLGIAMILRLLGYRDIPGYADNRDATKSFLDIFLSRPFHTRTGERLAREDFGRKESILIPGSFNPLHFGHIELMNVASTVSGKYPVLTITVDPPHKDPLSIQEILRRQKHLKGYDVLYSHGDPLFINKARSNPKTPFAIGADTMDRMLDPRWCPVEPMLKEFHELGTKFYVRGRSSTDGFLTKNDVEKKWNLKEDDKKLFIELPGRSDMSSTELRERERTKLC